MADILETGFPETDSHSETPTSRGLFLIHSDDIGFRASGSLAKGLHGHGILVTMATDVEVRPSRIEGLGIFAAHAFRAGERIRHINVLREVTPDLPIREDMGERLDHCSYPDGKVVLLGFPDRHVNHSCDPNAHELFEGTSSYIVARRDIASGDEITLDYNINIANGTSWPCRCGAARCRGLVVGDFFLLPKEWQREYRPLLAEWFIKRHRERLEALEDERWP